MTLATPKKAFGGHLEPGTAVFTFAIVTIGVMNEAIFRGLADKTIRSKFATVDKPQSC